MTYALNTYFILLFQASLISEITIYRRHYLYLTQWQYDALLCLFRRHIQCRDISSNKNKYCILDLWLTWWSTIEEIIIIRHFRLHGAEDILRL
jgi:hypothetical protein